MAKGFNENKFPVCLEFYLNYKRQMRCEFYLYYEEYRNDEPFYIGNNYTDGVTITEGNTVIQYSIRRILEL